MDERQLENLAVSLKTPSFVFDTDILKARAAHVAEKVKPANPDNDAVLPEEE